jgi:hypothetical protein
VLLARTALGATRGPNRTAELAPERPLPVGPPAEVVDPPTPLSPAAPASSGTLVETPPPSSGPGSRDPGPPTPPPADPGRSGPLVGPRRRRRRPLLVALAVALVVLAASLGTWLAVRDDGADPGASADAATSSPPAEDTGGDTGEDTGGEPAGDTGGEQDGGGAAPSSEDGQPTAAETAPSSPTEESPPPADPAAEAQETLEQYYALLPGDPEGAYALTGPTLRSRASPGYYADFFGRWGEVNLLDVRDVRQDGDRVTATTQVEFLDGPQARLVETHAVTFVRGDDGRLLIDLDVLA